MSTGFKRTHLYGRCILADRPDGAKPEWTFNMLLKHGVRSALEYAKSFDLVRAHAVSNPELAPHLEFVDLGGHGYAKVRLTGDEMRTEFVCIPRPIDAQRHRRTAGRCATASCIVRRSGARANGRNCGSRSWKAIPACQFSIAAGHSLLAA